MGFFTEFYYILVLFYRVFFPRGKFKAEDVPDLSGRIAIVTGMSSECLSWNDLFMGHAGGNVGIGRETIKVSDIHKCRKVFVMPVR